MDYTTLADKAVQEKVAEALSANNFIPTLLETKAGALAKIKELIPEGASLMNGASKTLEEIGFIDVLKAGNHGWNNLHDAVLAEQDPAKQALLRKQSVVSDFYLGSVHALTQEGEMIIASNTGSQLPHLVYTSPNIILVVSAQKITSTLAEGFKRLEEHVIPLENERMMGIYGAGTTHAKTLILHKEGAHSSRKIHVLIVNEKLGF